MKKNVIILLLIAIIFSIVCIYNINTSIFSVEKWSKNIYHREKMLENLLNRYNLNEMYYNDIISLLGDGESSGQQFIEYHIDKSLFTGLTVFNICFDENGKVVDYYVTVDP